VKPAQIIATLNSLRRGEMDTIRRRLDEARLACVGLEQLQLAERLEEARNALGRADVKTYRKQVETVIAQLGHLK